MGGFSRPCNNGRELVQDISRMTEAEKLVELTKAVDEFYNSGDLRAFLQTFLRLCVQAVIVEEVKKWKKQS